MPPFTSRSRSTTWSRYSEAQESMYAGGEQSSSVRYDLDSEPNRTKPRDPFASQHDYDAYGDDNFKTGITRPRRGSKLSAMKASTVSTAKNLISNLPTISRSSNSSSKRHYTDMENTLPETNREDDGTSQFPSWELPTTSAASASPGQPSFRVNDSPSPSFPDAPGHLSPGTGKKDLFSRLGSASPTKWGKGRRSRAYSAPNPTYKTPNPAEYSVDREPMPVLAMPKNESSTFNRSTGTSRGRYLQAPEPSGYPYARDSYDADRDFGEETEQRSLL
ncbi:hypothetical protein BROUX41_000573 [Berkeleyomyces rouxiae]